MPVVASGLQDTRFGLFATAPGVRYSRNDEKGADAMVDHVRVEFTTIDGVTLRGDFFQAEGGRTPCIVMTQGLSLLKDHYIQDHARKFVEAGISTLVYDHRGYGSSDGEPRHETKPIQQAEDYHDAVTAAMTLPHVDPTRLAIWGIGHSGGAATIAAASEPVSAGGVLAA
jgi:alpha-beta hydrolase superfamily lysophospholipase